jgi:hypothetical protein
LCDAEEGGEGVDREVWASTGGNGCGGMSLNRLGISTLSRRVLRSAMEASRSCSPGESKDWVDEDWVGAVSTT